MPTARDERKRRNNSINIQQKRCVSKLRLVSDCSESITAALTRHNGGGGGSGRHPPIKWPSKAFVWCWSAGEAIRFLGR